MSDIKKLLESFDNYETQGASAEEVANAIAHRISRQRLDLVSQHGVEAVMAAVDEVAQFYAGAEELGSSDISIMVKEVARQLNAGKTESVDEGVEALDEGIFTDLRKAIYKTPDEQNQEFLSQNLDEIQTLLKDAEGMVGYFKANTRSVISNALARAKNMIEKSADSSKPQYATMAVQYLEELRKYLKRAVYNKNTQLKTPKMEAGVEEDATDPKNMDFTDLDYSEMNKQPLDFTESLKKEWEAFLAESLVGEGDPDIPMDIHLANKERERQAFRDAMVRRWPEEVKRKADSAALKFYSRKDGEIDPQLNEFGAENPNSVNAPSSQGVAAPTQPGEEQDDNELANILSLAGQKDTALASKLKTPQVQDSMKKVNDALQKSGTGEDEMKKILVSLGVGN